MHKVVEEYFRNIEGKVERLIEVISCNENKVDRIIQQQESIFRLIDTGQETNKKYPVASISFCFLSIVLSWFSMHF